MLGIRRRNRSAPAHPKRPSRTAGTAASYRPSLFPLEDRLVPSADFRSIDGRWNNLGHPDWGSADTQLLRITPAAYGDGISTPAGADLPGAREISNAVGTQTDDGPNARLLSDFIYQWGQFIDHDMSLTQDANPAEPFNIPVPAGDAFFDPSGTGTQVISLNRSEYDPNTGVTTPRQQLNEITSFLDASQVYGSDPVRAAALRTFSGGRLNTSPGDLLPFNDAGLANQPNNSDGFFLAGDVRANEQPGITALQTLFVREHNRLADRIAAADPKLSDEAIYQRARRLVGAEIEAITYNEFLPALMGTPLPAYAGYDSTVDPAVANEFSTSAYRFGHSTLDDDVERFDNDGRESADGSMSLSDSFFNPSYILHDGIDSILKGAASGDAQEIDLQMVDGVRNFLFGPPGAGGFDLFALDVQRARDHGLAGYNATRVPYGLAPVSDFSGITSDPVVQKELADLYHSVDRVDLFVGGLAEDHVAGASVGPTFYRIIADQFERLRDGDRFWFESQFSGTQLNTLEHTRLSDVIRRNTDITNIQDNVFFFSAKIKGQVTEQLPGSPGMAGVTVQLLDDQGNLVAQTVTGAKGKFYFGELAMGTYQVREVPPPGWVQASADPSDVTITRGMIVSHVDFVNAPSTPAADPVRDLFNPELFSRDKAWDK